MSKNKLEGDCTRLMGVICLTIFLVSSVIVQAAPPVANDALVEVSKPIGTEIELTATGGPTSYSITSLPELGWLIDPNDGSTIAETPYTLSGNIVRYDESCPYYVTGAEAFTFQASNDDGDSNIATISLDIDLSETIYDPDGTTKWDYIPFLTALKKVRTQAIYHADELGSKAQTITSLALSIRTVPAIPIENWKIRMKHTAKTEYLSTDIFDNTGWTVVYSDASETIASTGWVDFLLQTPFEYDGTSNLMIDFSIDSTATNAGYGYVFNSDTGTEDRIISHWANLGDPLTFDTTGTKWNRLFNIKLQGDPAGTEELFYDLDFDCAVDLNDYVKLAEDWGGLYDIDDLVGLCGEWMLGK